MSWQEWRDTPWWVQRAYIEGMVNEEILEYSEEPAAATVGPKSVEKDPLGASLQEYADMGLRVIQGYGSSV
jgi:hypothetical protein